MITTAGVITEFTVPTVGGRPLGIVAGSDGALWFTETNGNKIGRITTAGVVTEFTIPTANSKPQVIAAGSDGALWFPEFNSNQIGRITTGAAPPLGQTVPTLDVRGLIALTLILAAIGVLVIRRMSP